MTNPRRQARSAHQRLVDTLGLDYQIQAQADGYRVSPVSPDSVEFTTSSWDGSDAEASYPNPTDDDTDLRTLADHYLFVPDELDADDPPSKSEFKAPMRDGVGGPVNTNALEAIIAAINGARGGFEGVSEDVLQGGFDWAIDALIEAGEYEGVDDAPEYDPEVQASDVDGIDADLTELTAEATGTVRMTVDSDQIEAADTDGDSLGGIVWGAGDHDLALGGKPTPVRVPAESIPPTFEAAEQDIEAGNITLGFDHPGPDSVAAKTGIVDIGQADSIGLSADEKYIVLTDSTLWNDQAVEAKENGEFDDLDWSVVADVAIRRDQDGDPVIEDGRVVLDATRINRIDAVDTGAVDAASIERSTADLPDLTDEVSRVKDAAAADLNQTHDAVQALQASATAYTQHMENRTFDPDVEDDDIPDAVAEQLSAAANIIDDMEDEMEAAKARADGFDRLLQAHGLDEDDYEGPEAAAQAVIDEQTEDIRQEIAELEAELGTFETEDPEARAKELAGNDPDELQNTLNARKATAFDVEQKRQNKGRAAAANDTVGKANFSGGDGNNSGDADDLALSAMDGSDRIEAEANGQSPAEYVQKKYGVHASQHESADEVRAEIMDAINGGDN